MADDEVVLEATGVKYGSNFDESAFFEWLDKIDAVRSFKGRLYTLYIRVDRVADEMSLRELLALFHRYHVDLAQLRVFDTPSVGDWFRRPGTYWHSAVFGETDDVRAQPINEPDPT